MELHTGRGPRRRCAGRLPGLGSPGAPAAQVHWRRDVPRLMSVEGDDLHGADLDGILGDLRSRVHREWQQRLVDELGRRGWQPPRQDASGGPVPWEEVASVSVEALWRDI